MSESLSKAIAKILSNSPNTVFLVDGVCISYIIERDFRAHKRNFIYVNDYMALGRASSTILSAEYIHLRSKSFNGPLAMEPYTESQYETEHASPLRKLAEFRDHPVALIQADCLISHIWQLTMLAYIEQLGIEGHVTQILFFETRSDFHVKDINQIDIRGAHADFCQLVCRHKPVNLQKYRIPYEAVSCYLELNGKNRILREYILQESTKYDNPYTACGQFLYDFPTWGLSDDVFLNLAYSILLESPEHKELSVKWKKFVRELYDDTKNIAPILDNDYNKNDYNKVEIK